ncbi:uncharacterized protein Trissin [Plodia interpunctella]|uniref:uncharacterized protein Trissin n=1 Tax=Plodia interpunctella TaxID=58824 RepID=UPI002367A06F|nr:uncharacterized protein LOC128670279 [Plodia interpunctella]
MFKITAVVSLMLIGSTLWATSLSCDSCGSECASACGTRLFRSCCFNYLRKKRLPDNVKLWTPNTPKNQIKSESAEEVLKPKLPFYIVDDIADSWKNPVSNDIGSYPDGERLQIVYDV